MAIYIKGVEMPKDDDCTILTVYSDGVVYLRQYKGRMCLEDSTNATDIPEPHGRLILEDTKEVVIDAVEVVRCKDCKHRETEGCQIKVSQYGIYDDDFCSYGERRE